ncbi:MAG: hypothetical protein ACEPOW_09285 [Bacteroidales bacterium]
MGCVFFKSASIGNNLLSKFHTLAVVFFSNSELENFIDKKARDIEEVYEKTMAEKILHEKRQISLELDRNGIYSILSTPEGLTVNCINKYIELKGKGVI